ACARQALSASRLAWMSARSAISMAAMLERRRPPRKGRRVAHAQGRGVVWLILRLVKAAYACDGERMSVEVSIGNGDGARLSPHPLRAAILGEVHARPFTSIETPRRVLHFAFDTAGEPAQADRAALTEFCAR